MAIAASVEAAQLNPKRLAQADLRGKIEVRGALLWGDLMVRGFFPKVIGQEHIPQDEQVVFVFNHTTHPWRFFRQWQLLPDVSLVRQQGQKHNRRPVAVVAQYTRKPHPNPEIHAANKADAPYRRRRIAAAGLVPVDPFGIDREFIPTARAVARLGKSFAISGEGIHRPENALQDPQTKGAAKLAIELGMKVVPVYMRDANAWRPALPFLKRNRPVVVFGEALLPPQIPEGATPNKRVLDTFAGQITDGLRRQQAIALAA